MQFLVLGCGMMGRAIVYDLLRDSENYVIAVDIAAELLDRLSKDINSDRLRTIRGNVLDRNLLARIIKDYNIDVVVNALPHSIALKLIPVEAELGIKVVDLTYEDPLLEYDSIARDNNSRIAIGCGVAPGLSDMLIAYSISKLDSVDEALIYVGGVLKNPEPPLYYRVLFNIESLWNEYVEAAKIIDNGSIKYVEALSGLENIEVEGLGRFEAFYTDGFRSVIKFLERKGIKINRGFEKTLRNPGHINIVKTLRDLGFLSKNPVDYKGFKVIPRELTTVMLKPYLEFRHGIDEDITILITIIRGVKNGSKIEYKSTLIDYYDLKTRHTSMARTTGYTAAVIARLLALKEEYFKPGIILPGDIGYSNQLMEIILEELTKRDIKVEFKSSSINT